MQVIKLEDIVVMHDLGGYPLDGPLPTSDETEGDKSRQILIRQIADEYGFTIRQLYQWIATGRGHLTIVGSATQVADTLEEWFVNEAADGFNVLPPWLPGALDDFIELVILELQRRGLFRTAYEGRTLRENLGLPYPTNRWSSARSYLAETSVRHVWGFSARARWMSPRPSTR